MDVLGSSGSRGLLINVRAGTCVLLPFLSLLPGSIAHAPYTPCGVWGRSTLLIRIRRAFVARMMSMRPTAGRRGGPHGGRGEARGRRHTRGARLGHQPDRGAHEPRRCDCARAGRARNSRCETSRNWRIKRAKKKIAERNANPRFWIESRSSSLLQAPLSVAPGRPFPGGEDRRPGGLLQPRRTSEARVRPRQQGPAARWDSAFKSQPRASLEALECSSLAKLSHACAVECVRIQISGVRAVNRAPLA